MDGVGFERRELAALRGMAAEAGRGSAAVVVDLAGADGSGRTTLLGALAEGLTRDGWLALHVRGYPGHGSSRRSLAELAQQLAMGLPAEERRTVALVIDRALLRSEQAHRLFAEPDIEEETESFRRALRQKLAQKPLLVALDDGHLAEGLVFRFLEQVLATGGGSRLFVAASDGGRALPHPFESARRITLSQLDEAELDALLGASGVAAEAAAVAARALHAAGLRTPLAAALARHRLEGGHPPEEAARGGFLALLGERLARVDAAERELLEVASVSVSGLNFWRLERLWVTTRDEVARLTASLERAGILRPTYPGGKLRLVFRHDEERRALYEAIDEARRRQLHARMANVVAEDDLDPAEQCSEVGWHLLLGGDELAGAAKLLEAGTLMRRAGRHGEAKALFAEVKRRASSGRALERERFYACEGLGDVERHVGSAAEASVLYRRALEEGAALWNAKDRVRLLRKLARSQLLAGAVEESEGLVTRALSECGEDDLTERVLLLDLATNLAMRRGDMVAAASQSQQAVVIALRAKDDRLRARVQRTLGLLRSQRGDLKGALSDLETALQLYQKTDDAAGYAAVSNVMGNVFLALDRQRDAIGAYRTSLRIHEALGSHTGMTAALNNLATLHMSGNELDEAEGALRRCLAIEMETGDWDGAAIAEVNLAMIELGRSRAGEALSRADAALALAERVKSRSTALAARLARLMAFTSMARLKEALDLALELEREARSAGNIQPLVWALSTGARVHLLLGDFDRSAQWLAEGLRLCQEHGLPRAVRDCLWGSMDAAVERGDFEEAKGTLDRLEREGPATSPADRKLRAIVAIELRSRGGREPLSAADRATLERTAAEGDRDPAARACRLLAQALPPSEAIPYAEKAYAMQRDSPDDLWRAALRLGEIERALGRTEAKAHLEEAARTVLGMAATLTDEQREAFLAASGRRRALRYAPLE